MRRYHLLQQRGVSRYRRSEKRLSSEKLKLHAAEAGGI